MTEAVAVRCPHCGGSQRRRDARGEYICWHCSGDGTVLAPGIPVSAPVLSVMETARRMEELAASAWIEGRTVGLHLQDAAIHLRRLGSIEGQDFAGRGFACASKEQGSDGGNDAADCGWPFCGCDPAAAGVLDAIEDAGCVFVPREATPAMLEAGRAAQSMGDETLDAGDMAAKWRAMLEAAGVR